MTQIIPQNTVDVQLRPNPEYESYCLRFNVLMHDYGYHPDELAVIMGPEPVRWIEVEVVERDYRQSMDDSSYRRGY